MGMNEVIIIYRYINESDEDGVVCEETTNDQGELIRQMEDAKADYLADGFKVDSEDDEGYTLVKTDDEDDAVEYIYLSVKEHDYTTVGEYYADEIRDMRENQ